jgi:hypothetical protein
MFWMISGGLVKNDMATVGAVGQTLHGGHYMENAGHSGRNGDLRIDV